MTRHSLLAVIFLMLASPTTRARPRTDTLHLDVEVDPTAYVFAGYSAHLGIGGERVRVDLGAYAMDLPGFLHGNDGWDASFAGFGVKLQWFVREAQRGLFVDVGTGDSRRDVTLQRTGRHRRAWVPSVGAISLPHRFYVSPWAGLTVDLASPTLVVDGERFETSRVTPFAAVHVGHRFR